MATIFERSVYVTQNKMKANTTNDNLQGLILSEAFIKTYAYIEYIIVCLQVGTAEISNEMISIDNTAVIILFYVILLLQC